MPAKQNKAIVRRLYEEVDKGNIAILDQIFSGSYVDHNPPPVGLAAGIKGLKQAFRMFLTAFPDGKHILEDVIAEGNKVVVRVTGLGTQKAEFMGVPPTGKKVTMTGIAIYRFVNGRIVEKWGEQDRVSIMQQLGVMPPTAQAK